MKVIETQLKGVLIIEPKMFNDGRGYFLETYQSERYCAAGIVSQFKQDNLSYSVQNTLRGLHYQYPFEQAKLVQVLKGEVFDVAVDIRAGSPTFGKWEGVWLSVDNGRQLFIPEGFAHGFCVTSDDAIFSYKCSNLYHPDSEGGITWNDPEININWPIDEPIISKKDDNYSTLNETPEKRLPKFIP